MRRGIAWVCYLGSMCVIVSFALWDADVLMTRAAGAVLALATVVMIQTGRTLWDGSDVPTRVAVQVWRTTRPIKPGETVDETNAKRLR